MDKDTIAWLLEDTNPAVRYRTLTELLDHSRTAASVKEAKVRTQNMPELEQLFQRRSEDGCWYISNPKTREKVKEPLNYQNIYYLSTVLQYCAEFGLDASDTRITNAINRFFSEMDNLENETLREPCKYTQFIRPLVLMGYRDHPQLQKLVDHLVASIRWDNGFLCDRLVRKRKIRPVKSCVLGTHPALLAFSSLPELWGTEACERLVEYFLRRDVLFRTESPGSSRAIKVLAKGGSGRAFVHRQIGLTQFPFGLYGLSGLLFSLSKLGYGSRKELATAWGQLEDHRRPNGRYTIDSKSPYSNDRHNRLPSVGKRYDENKWVTFYALLSLRFADLD